MNRYVGPGCPCDPNALVRVQAANGETETGVAGLFDWAGDTDPDLRVVEWELAEPGTLDGDMRRVPAPIDMVLYCPSCGRQHVDAPSGDHAPGCNISCGMPAHGCSCSSYWANPPHRSHLCAECGHVWRPADVCTNGVQAITTKGKNDSPVIPRIQLALFEGQ